jgi:hypothetical protein
MIDGFRAVGCGFIAALLFTERRRDFLLDDKGCCVGLDRLRAG